MPELATLDLLRAVRDGHPPSQDALRAFVAGAATGGVPDYQLTAFLMAVTLRGLDQASTVELTRAMRDSGVVLDFKHIGRPTIDKHSTGGVGDKVSLCLAPWVAACGVAVPMMSGRGLGHTGGTLDKLASIPGFRTDLTPAAFVGLVERHHVGFIGQSAQFAPADGKFYALRDVTATVESVPLITASILAKKLAEGIDGLVLDVKVGRGAFMPTLEAARELARSIIAVGRTLGLRVVAVFTDMQAPLGRAIGNALEVVEAMAVLEGTGPVDVEELTLTLGARMLRLAEVASTIDAARAMLLSARASGAAKERFVAMVAAQGGQVSSLAAGGAGLPRAPKQTPILARRAGYVVDIDALAMGRVATVLGGGRQRAADTIDPAVGLVLSCAVGERVDAGAPLCVVHHASELSHALALDIEAAFAVADAPPPPRPLVLEVLDEEATLDGSL